MDLGADVSQHIVCTAKEFQLENNFVLSGCHRADHYFCRSGLCRPDTSRRRALAPGKPGESDLRPRSRSKQLTGRTLWVSILSCLQLFRTCLLPGFPVPQTVAEPFHSPMGHTELLYTHLSGSTLSGRPDCRSCHRMLRSCTDVLSVEENSQRHLLRQSETYGNHDLCRFADHVGNSDLRFHHGIIILTFGVLEKTSSFKIQKADGNALLPYEACVPSAYHLYYQP